MSDSREKWEEDRVRELLDEQRLIFEYAQVGILQLQNRFILKCNRRVAEMFGFTSPQELEGHTTEIFYPSHADFIKGGEKGYGQLTRNGAAVIETQLCRRDGQLIWVLQHGRPLDPRNVLEAPSIWVYTDITAQKESEIALQHSRQIFSAAFESCPIAASIASMADGRFIEVNANYERDFGWARDEMIGRTSLEIGLWPSIETRNTWVAAMQQTPRLVNYETIWQGKDKKLRNVSLSSEITDLNGTPCILAYVTDITERKQAEEKIQALAFHDPLTALANRTSLHEQLAQAVRLARRNEQSFALMLLDLDNFKSVNDSLGHHVGDGLLIAVAGRLQSAVRQSDLVARLGGDEFVILLPNLESPADAAHVADKILAALATPCQVENYELRTSTSIGICLYPDDASEGVDMLQKADTAMYHAKANGRNQYQFFKEEYQLAALKRLALEADLRKAIEEKQFVLYYQPQLDLRSGRIEGVEALIRWQHPERGMVSPLEFIPFAEETGLILQIGDWVLEEACRQLSIWHSRGIEGLCMSVNLTASQFLDSVLPDHIKSLLRQYDLAPEQIRLEITESMSMDSPEQTIASMRELSACGFQLSIDDFGTGYSSLAYLKMFPLHTLKIDRSFVKDIETDQNDADICDVTVLLAHKLGLDVIGEGVETEAQLKYLLSIGCEKIQGYLVSKPLPAEMAEQFIRNNPRMPGLGTVDLWPNQ